MIPDKAVGKVKHFHEAGIISFRLSIHDVSKNGPINFKEKKSSVWSKRVPKRSNPVKIRAYIY